jgi:hypothetical protein
MWKFLPGKARRMHITDAQNVRQSAALRLARPLQSRCHGKDQNGSEGPDG